MNRRRLTLNQVVASGSSKKSIGGVSESALSRGEARHIGLGAESLIAEHVSSHGSGDLFCVAGMKYYPYSGGLVEDTIDQLK